MPEGTILDSLLKRLNYLPVQREAQSDPQAFGESLRRSPTTDPELLNALMSNMPLGGGVIAPTGNKVLQGLLEQAKNVAPKLIKRAEDEARTVYNYLVPKPPMPNTLGTYRDIEFGPQIAKLLPKSSPVPGEVQIWGGQSKNDMLESLLHELTHFTSVPQVATKNPMHALETAAQLTEMMPTRQAKAMQRYLPTRSQMSDVLTKMAAGKPHLSSLTSPQDAAKQAYSESLSYLTESLLQPTTKGGDPMLSLIADELGLGLR